jgi:hypothetical protein
MERRLGERVFGSAIWMRKIVVRKRKIEKEFNNLKLIYVVYDVSEIETHDSGTVEISVRQIYDVLDVWDFEDVNELF